jgi:hypothetical protein
LVLRRADAVDYQGGAVIQKAGTRRSLRARMDTAVCRPMMSQASWGRRVFILGARNEAEKRASSNQVKMGSI